MVGRRHRRVGAGLPAKRPALLANFHPPFTVAAATVFAGKPAPTPDRCWTRIGGWAQAPTPDRWWTRIGGWAQAPSCRSGFTREEAGPAGQLPPAIHRCRRYRIRG
ncbi:hypothetical protein PRJ_3679 [Pseudomonas sp. XWY-1]|nr:hypothetical protein PRJ_3679 [Pseudomonas sp. XWY-1]